MALPNTLPKDSLEAGPSGLLSLFQRNRAWAGGKTSHDPGFFSRLVGQQRPRYFWIGCSDSRVPATEIVDLDPGEMFVHRNVANLAVADDPNFTAALQFAVEELAVQHVIVVGHYGCGGVQAAINGNSEGAISRWLQPLRIRFLEACTHHHRPTPNRLCEDNVEAQVQALAVNPLITAAWERGADLTLHGWVYAIGDGLLQAVCAPVGPPVVPAA